MAGPFKIRLMESYLALTNLFQFFKSSELQVLTIYKIHECCYTQLQLRMQYIT